MWGIFGRADGAPFDAEEFPRNHPHRDWQGGCPQSRPAQPWTLFPGMSEEQAANDVPSGGRRTGRSTAAFPLS